MVPDFMRYTLGHPGDLTQLTWFGLEYGFRGVEPFQQTFEEQITDTGNAFQC